MVQNLKWNLELEIECLCTELWVKTCRISSTLNGGVRNKFPMLIEVIAKVISAMTEKKWSGHERLDCF